MFGTKILPTFVFEDALYVDEMLPLLYRPGESLGIAPTVIGISHCILI